MDGEKFYTMPRHQEWWGGTPAATRSEAVGHYRDQCLVEVDGFFFGGGFGVCVDWLRVWVCFFFGGCVLVGVECWLSCVFWLSVEC